MGWRLAKSLEQLRAEINVFAPKRSAVSDGTLGDRKHASRPSRHNPNDAGVVCALDITHDPARGCDIHAIARELVQRPHPNLEYVISQGEVAKRSKGFVWEPYTGENKHNQHAHFAVGRGKDGEPGPPYDDTTEWGIASPKQEEDDLAGEGPEILTRLREIQETQERQNEKLKALEEKLAALASK